MRTGGIEMIRVVQKIRVVELAKHAGSIPLILKK